MNAYQKAQAGISLLKSAVLEYLRECGQHGLTNAEIGKALGIYMGHVRHEGHISRTILAVLEDDGLVHQDPATKKWFPVRNDNSLAMKTGK